MRSNSYTAIAGSTSSSLTSAPIPVSQMTQFSVIVSVTGDGTAAGTVTVEASNDVGTGFPVTESTPSPWVTLPGVSAAVSGNGQVLIPITNVAYQYIRVVYTRSAGTGGVIVCTVDTTGPSPGVGFWPGGDLAGTVTSQTVIGIQGNPVSSTAPSSGEVLTWSGTDWAPAAGGGGSGGSPAQPAAWGDEYLWWKLNDAFGVNSAANSGSAGSATLSTTGSGQGPQSGFAGPYSLATKFLTNYGYAGASGLVGSISTALTASIWVKDMGSLAGGYYFLVKTNSGGAFSLQISQFINQLTFALRIGSNGSGTLYSATSPLSNLMSLSGPYFLSLTYDGSAIRGYLNGTEVASYAQAGTIDWDTANPGAWRVGDGGVGSSVPLATMYDVRIAPSVRSAAQLLADYKTGQGYSY